MMGESRDKVATKRWSDQSLINVKKALITGADGFIGSHLTEMLVSMGFEVEHSPSTTPSTAGVG